MASTRKKKSRSLLLQSLEERILWDATMQPSVPDEPVNQEQQAIVADSTSQTPDILAEDPPLNAESNQTSAEQPENNDQTELISSNETSSENAAMEDGASSVELGMSDTDIGLNIAGAANQLAVNNEIQFPVEVVIIDSSVENSSALIADILQQNTDNNRNLTIIEINGAESGLDQVTDILEAIGEPVDSLHIVGHGDQDQIFLGADRLSNDNIKSQQESLANWSNFLSDSADLLFYGCDVVENGQGELLLSQIADITGADVSGSDDTTGSENLGGDWDLEFSIGAIETNAILQESVAATWSGILAVDAPIGGIDAPATIMIDENPDISLNFDAPAGSDTGFGPYGDFISGDELDINGIDYLGAPVSFTEVGTWDGVQWVDSANNPITNHPFDNIAAAALPIPTGLDVGDTWFAVELPFGSFTEGQPAVELNIDAEFNANAEVGSPIDLSWTPGYLLGANAEGAPINPDGTANAPVVGTTSTASITPEVIQIEKRDDLPEQETPTGPNFPVEYTITVNVAEGETVDNVIVTDYLPANSVFLGFGSPLDPTTADVAGINGATSTLSNVTVDAGTNTITVDLGSVTGANGVTGEAAASGEIEITYYVYFEDIVTSGGTPDINNIPSLNESTVTGVHNGVMVTDIGDSDTAGVGDGGLDDGDVQVDVQNLTTQKTPQVVTGFNPDGSPILAPLEGNAIIPGALILWTVDIQVSDFHAFDNLAFTDQLSDGQEFVDGSSNFILADGTVVNAANLTPTLFVGNDSDFGGNTDDSTATPIAFDAANVYTAGEMPPAATIDIADGTLTNPPGTSATGEVTTIFDISQQLRDNGSDGVLVGDLNNTNDLDGDTLPADITVPRLGANATTVTLTFFSTIREELTDVSGDVSLNAGDPIGNDGEIQGDVGDVADDGTFTADPNVDGPLIDDTSFEIEVAGVSIDKTIYAVNQVEVQNPDFFDGSANPDEDDNESDEAIIAGIQPGDEVTYRIRVDLASVNGENFVISDFLPLPVYDVSDFATSGFSNNPGDAPVVGNFVSGDIQYGEDYNLQDTDLIVNVPPAGSPLNVGDSHPADNSYPQVSFDAINNQLNFDFGTFDEIDINGDSSNFPVVIDLLITATVLDNPIADSAAITNQAQVGETDSSGNPISTEDIVQIQYIAPDLTIEKGVVAIDSNSAGTLTSPGVDFGVDFAATDPGSAQAIPANDSLSFGADTISVADFQSGAGILDSDAIDVDGGDHVRYALTVVNEGQGDANDILVEDQLPDIASGFVIPANTADTLTAVNDLNLQVYDGAGNRLTAGTDFTVEIDGGALFVEFIRELDGRTDDGTGNEVADSDEILADPNPGNVDASEVFNTVEGDEIFIIVYDLEVDNEQALDASGAAPETTYTNTAEITEYFQVAEADRDNDDNDLAEEGDPDLIATAQVTTPDVEVTKTIVETDLDALNATGSNDDTQATIGERITYEVRVQIPEGEVLNAQIIDNLQEGLELSSIDSVRIVDGNDNPINTLQSSAIAGFAEYSAPDAMGEILTAQLDNVGGPLAYNEVEDGSSTITLELGTLFNTNEDATVDEFIVLTYTVLVINDSANVSGANRENEASLAWQVDDGNGGTTSQSSDAGSASIEIVEPELEVIKTVEVAGVASTGNANDQVNPDSVTGDIGDPVTYTIVIQHTGDSDTDAYDVTFSDQVPSQITSVNLVSAIYSEGATSDLVATGDIILTGNDITTANDFTIAFGETVTVTVTGIIDTSGSVNVGDVIDNTGEITYTSFPETPDTSNFVAGTDDAERGPDGSDGELDGYNDSDPAIIEIVNSIEKYLVNSELTDELDATGDGQLAPIDDADGINRGLEATIGETLTYEVVITVAEGITNNAVIQDTLDPGLVLVSIDSIETRRIDTDTNTILPGAVPNVDIDNQTGLFGGIPATDASNDFIDYTHVPGAVSDTLMLDLGTINNTNNDNNIDEQIVLRYTVMVSDIVGNQGNQGNGAGTTGTQRNNSAELIFTDATGANTLTSGPDSADNIEIVEPDLEVVKDVATNGPGDAGDEVTYTITIQHTGDSESDAFDVSLADTLPTSVDFTGVNFASGANIVVTDSNGVLGSGDFEVSAGSLQFAATANTEVDELGNNTVDFQLGTTPPRIVTIEITGILTDAVQPGDLIENDANIQYSSLDQHDDGSTDPAGDGDDEEDRSDFVPDAAEDSQRIYTDTDEADFVVPSPTIEKELTGTDVTATGNAANQATIGERVTYTITIGVPEGEIDNVSILDTLDPGLEFFDVVSISGTLNGSDVVTDLAGGFSNVDATNITGDATSGQSLTFELGNLTVADDNSGVDATTTTQGDDFIVIEYRAVVTDIDANVDGRSGINNSAELSYETDATTGPQTIAAVEADPISLVEPELEVIKQINGLADEVDDANLDAGDTVTYLITIQHTGGSSTTAFDTELNDVLPGVIDFSAVDFPAGANVVVTDSSGTLTTSDFAINSGVLQFDEAGSTPTTVDIELDRVITIAITGVISNDSTPNSIITNQADINYTSLPEGHDNNGEENERGEEGFDDTGANPYQDSDDISFTTPLPVFEKSVISSSIHGNGVDTTVDLTIGEEVTYELVITLNEGTTPVLVTDNLPNNATGELQLVNAEVSFIGAGVLSNTNGLAVGDDLTSTFISSPNVNQAIFNFGNVVVDGNNITAAEDNVIRVQVTAVVVDIASNENTDTLTNSANLNFAENPNNPDPSEVLTDTADVDIIEPELDITKIFVDPTTGAPIDVVVPGDTVRVRLTVENTGTANAYDVVVGDLINSEDEVFINPVLAAAPTGFTFNFTDGGSGAGVPEATDNVTFSADPGVFIPPASGPLIFEFDVTLTDAVVGSNVFPGLRVDNTATVVGDTLDGDPLLSNGQPNEEQRETTDSDFDSIAGLPPFDKSVLSSNVTDATNGITDATIGERVVYQIEFVIPDSDFDGDGFSEAVALSVTDNLPDTLELLDARVVSIGAEITGSDLVAGDSLLGGIAGTGTIIASDVNTVDSFDDRVVLNFGDVTVNDDDNNLDTGQTIIIEVEAIVKDDAANFSDDPTDPSDDAVNDKVNVAEMTFGPITQSDTATVEIIEPILEIEKNFVDTNTGQPIFSAQAGDIVQIELTIENTGTAVAYDVFVEDALNAGVLAGQYVDGSAVVVDDGGFNNVSMLGVGQNLVRLEADTLAAGATQTFRINVELSATLDLAPGEAIENTATVEGESLDIDTLADPADAADSRTTSDEDQDFIFGIPSIQKEVADNDSVVGDNDLLATSHVGTSSATGDPALEDLTIGEIVTYEVTIVLPADTFNAGAIELVPTSISDQLPAGLGLVDARVVSIGGNQTIGDSDGGEIVTDTSSAALLDAGGGPGGPSLLINNTNGSSTNLAIGDSLLGGATGITGTVGGSTVVFDFGGLGTNTVVVDENGDGTFERENTNSFTDLIGVEQSIVVQIDAIVLDSMDTTGPITNPFTNQATLTYVQSTANPIEISDTADVEVVEPEVEIEKSFRDPVTGVDLYTIEPGQQVLVELSVTNTGDANAYDVVVNDEIDLMFWENITDQTTPAGFTFNIEDGVTAVPMDTVTFTMDSNLTSFIAPNQTVIFEFLIDYNGAGGAGFELINTAEVEAQALPESEIPEPLNPDGSSAGLDVDRTTDDEDSDEVYQAPSLDKEFTAGLNPNTGTNQFDPTIPDVAIGEVVIYDLTVTLPESPVDDMGNIIPIQVNLIDDLPDGFGLVGVEITDIGSAVTSPNLVAGDGIEILNPTTLTPIVDVNSNITTADNFADPNMTADEVTLNFGAVTVDPTSNNVANQTITVQVTAVVLDISPENDIGEIQTNEATLEFFGTPTGDPTMPFDETTPIEITDSVDVEITPIPEDPMSDPTPDPVSSSPSNPINTPEVEQELTIFDIFSFDFFDRNQESFDEFILQVRNEIQSELEKLPIAYMATGITEHGSNVTMHIYNESGAIIGFNTVLADAAGNWVITFPNLVLDEIPHRVEVFVTPASYNDSTEGEYNTRVYYTPALDSRFFYSNPLDTNDVFNEKASNVIENLHQGNLNPLGEYDEDWNHPYEFLAISNNEKI